MKLTKKQIDIIIANTPAKLKGTYPAIVADLGYFMKADANWSYKAGYTFDGYLVVTVFGCVQ